MLIDYSPRRSGKTTRLIQWLREEKKRALIVMNDLMEKVMAKEYPDVAGQIYSVANWKRDYPAPSGYLTIAVDNADMILQHLLGQRITRASFSSFEDELNEHMK